MYKLLIFSVLLSLAKIIFVSIWEKCPITKQKSGEIGHRIFVKNYCNCILEAFAFGIFCMQ